MPNGRVQVQDLSAPERIQPAPIQSDTFMGAPRPVEDNNLGRLAESLGFFNKNLQAYYRADLAQSKADAAEAKRLHTEQMMAEYNHWLSSATDTERLAAIREGRVPYAADPYIGKIVRTDYAHLEAQALARSIDEDLAKNPGLLTDPNFNAERYVLDKARPTADKFYDSADAMQAFRKGVDTIRDGVINRRNKLVGESVERAFDDISYRQIDGAIREGIKNGAEGGVIAAEVRKLYAELGPRLKGGSLDMQYGRLDAIQLNVLKDLSKDPRYARVAMEMIEQDRVDTATGTRLGKLSDAYGNREAVKSIRETATKALADEEDEQFRRMVRESDEMALLRGDGEAASINDFKRTNSIDGSRKMHITAEKRKAEALQAVLMRIRMENGGSQDFEKEYLVTVGNGLKHPEWLAKINDGFAGDLSSATDPNQIQKIIAAADQYNAISDRNHSYVEAHVDSKARVFFDTYTALVRYGGMTPEKAAQSTALAFSSHDNAKDPQVAAGKRADIESKVRGMDFSWVPFSGSVSNTGELQQKLITYADALARVGKMSPDEAISMARDRIKESATYVNGKAVFGIQGLDKEDGKYFTPILENIYKKNKAYLDSKDLKAGDLSVSAMPSGQFIVTDSHGIPVIIPEMEGGKPVGFVTPKIFIGDIMKLRAAEKERKKAEAVHTILGRRVSPTREVTDEDFLNIAQ